MNKNHFVILLGLLVLITPFTGFPQEFKTFVFIISGLFISLFSYLSAREQRLFKSKKGDIFEENGDAQFQSNNSKQDSLLDS